MESAEGEQEQLSDENKAEVVPDAVEAKKSSSDAAAAIEDSESKDLLLHPKTEPLEPESSDGPSTDEVSPVSLSVLSQIYRQDCFLC